MPSASPRLLYSESPGIPARLIGRFYFGTSAVVALCSAGALSVWPHGIGMEARLALIAGVLAFALLACVSVWLSRLSRFPINAALFVVALASIVVCGAVGLGVGDGVRSPTFGFCAIAVCLVSAIAGLRYGMALGVLTLLQAVGLAWSELRGFAVVPPGATPLGLTLSFQALVIACSFAGGALISRMIDHYLRTAAEREERFHGLLRIAADWYWEQDHLFRYSLISDSSSGRPDPSSTPWIKRTPWQIPDLGLTDGELDAHRADLESHLPFEGLLIRRRDERGRWRTHSLSGEPKFDADDVFRGYWGVARDVTDELRTQRAVKASETRYRELFTRSPSPLFLHRRGLIFDANEAAARLFGFPNAAAMNGFNYAGFFPPGEARDRALERVGEMDRLPLGEGLPVIDLQVRSIDGRSLSVQSTAVRVDTASGPAVLSIFFDITARQAVEGALRRSEAMLSHLFATSPDCIALTEMATGRYAMVNPAFCRLTGFSAEEVVGRTSAELGLWHDQRVADHLTALLERNGTVTDLPAVFVSKSGALVSMLLAAGRFVMDQRDYLVVNARDVTASERTRLEHSAILERASIGIAFTRDRHFVQANPYFEAMFGWPAGGLVGQHGTAVWATDGDYAEIGELAGPLLSAGQPFEIERQMSRPDGSRFWCRLLAQAVDLSDPSHGGTIWIAEDVTERRRLDQALAAARDAAEAASLAKSAFLANTSHEIRTPLNGLLGLARLAMQPDLPDRRRREYLAQILDSAQSLAGIMSDILDVSKIEAGKIALDNVPFDLGDCLQAVYHAYQPLAESKGVELSFVLDPSLPVTVRGDPIRLRQILSNFITNALKFTERGTVIVSAELTGRGDIRLAVEDTGPGVDAATQERLFTPFSQGDSSTTRRYGGTGLGLSICRELAQLMGGRVGVVSARGEGSTFWAEIPLPSTEPALPPESTEARDIAQLTGKRILMVEDNPVNMMIGVAMLEHWGMRVAQAFDGRMAVDAVHDALHEGEPFDAVLMDVQMPIMSGHEASRELRRHFPSQALPIIALTAAALVSEREEALRSGMDDFLTKPIDAPRLRQTLARRIAG